MHDRSFSSSERSCNASGAAADRINRPIANWKKAEVNPATAHVWEKIQLIGWARSQ
jgi:hypothetical protein